MTPSRLLGLAIVATIAAMPAAAQEVGDRVRLDDFAVPASVTPSRMEQLSNGSASRPQPAPSVDRILEAPPANDPRGAMPDQLSSETGRRSPVQVSDRAQSRVAGSAAISSREDSTPGSVERLRGRDRCEPQMAQAVLAECLRILELRAAEFDAPAPPQLSAEQKLMAERDVPDEGGLNRSADQRLRMATVTRPDADLQSNQELASIYLADRPTPPRREPEIPPEQEASGLAAILGALGLDAAGPLSGD